MLEQLKIQIESTTVYSAGLPHFLGNFSRDSFISGMILRDANLLHNQLQFSAEKQGLHKNSITGEELGKIFHEFPEVAIRGCTTAFNACDTTALYLMAHEYYQNITGDFELAKLQNENIKKAVDYILSHISKGVFIEDPQFCDASKFALKVTYWKDSEVPFRKGGEPDYPVAYLLAHVQNLAGLRSAATILKTNIWDELIAEMVINLDYFFDKKKLQFRYLIDQKGSFENYSSDALNMLFYLQPGDLTVEHLEAVQICANNLTTILGFRTLPYDVSKDVSDRYHAVTVWPFEQALIHIGAKRFGLEKVAQTASYIYKFLDTEPEIFELDNICNDNTCEFKKGGCNPQLWTIAAKEYFKHQLELDEE